jgi:HEAT repeat protein
MGTLRTSGKAQVMLWLGTAFQVLVCALSFFSYRTWRQPVGPSVITLYLIALGWLWLGAAQLDDWYPHLAQALLLVVPLTVFGLQTLQESGAPALRRARRLAQRMANRKDWPADLGACRTLPEVKALREALHVDAAPALSLLQNPRPQVRVAALAALEYHQNWQPGHAELVLHHAQRTEEPVVRAAAVIALANVDDRLVVETLAEFLRDPSWEVRRAATEAILWDMEHRWAWIRHAIRWSLSDPDHEGDGPLWHEGQLLTPEAVADLTAWASEKGVLASRAAATLGVHYGVALRERSDDTVVFELRQQLANPSTPTALRLEIARLLRRNQELDRDLLEKLLNPANPAPLRLIAVEALLADSNHPLALAALRELAHLPNREIALATAEVLQRRLGVDMGLALDKPLPPLNSREAVEVTRRVIWWASEQKKMAGSEWRVGATI